MEIKTVLCQEAYKLNREKNAKKILQGNKEQTLRPDEIIIEMLVALTWFGNW